MTIKLLLPLRRINLSDGINNVFISILYSFDVDIGKEYYLT